MISTENPCITQGNLAFARSLTLITSAKSPLPLRVAWSQVLRIRVQTSLGGHYASYMGEIQELLGTKTRAGRDWINGYISESISWCGFQQKSQQIGGKKLPTEKKSRHQDNTFSYQLPNFARETQYSLFSQYLNKLITLKGLFCHLVFNFVAGETSLLRYLKFCSKHLWEWVDNY